MAAAMATMAEEAGLEKPQRGFARVLADTSSAPFVHLARDTGGEQKSEPHPFAPEIQKLLEASDDVIAVSDSPSRPLQRKVKVLPPDATCQPMIGEAEWVDTPERLSALRSILEGVGEVGIDTEQHSQRSFLGFTALLQISTEDGDYLVDAIALHDHLYMLREVFANPNIIKVFHGADSDCLWLQRDFHIYVVNLFDTARACSVLAKPQRSLAYLLQSYCGVIPDKSFQRADWRERPLPPAMLHYARTDAHFLLFLAARLRWELLHADGVITSHFPSETIHNTTMNEDNSADSFYKSAPGLSSGLEPTIDLDPNVSLSSKGVKRGEVKREKEGSQSSKGEGLYVQTLRRSNGICMHLYEKETSAGIAATSLLSRHLSGAGEGRHGRHRALTVPISMLSFRVSWAFK